MRIVNTGVNWNWFYTDTLEGAKEWFKELTGVEPYDFTIIPPTERELAGEYDDYYGFRLHK